MFFYHASPNPDLVGEKLKLTKNRNGAVYACVATTKVQAFFWAGALKENRSNTFYIYKVHVPDGDVVEDCRGHYLFEYRGVQKKAKEVEKHTDLDGEVCLFKEYPILERVAKIKFEEEFLYPHSEE